MGQRPFSIGLCFSDGYAAFRANIGPAILGHAIHSLILFIIQYIPVVNIIAPIFLIPPLQGGLSILQINLIRRKNPAIADLLGGFEYYGRFMGAYLLLALAGTGLTLVAMIPAFLGVRSLSPALIQLFTANSAPDQATRTMLATALASATPWIVLTAVCIIAVTIIMIRWSLVFIVIADDPEHHTVFEAFRRSAELTQGNRLGVYLTTLLSGMLASAGALACGIGVLFTIPIAACTFAAAYVQLAEPRAGDADEAAIPQYSAPSAYAPPAPPPPSTWLSPPPEAVVPPAMPSLAQTDQTAATAWPHPAAAERKEIQAGQVADSPSAQHPSDPTTPINLNPRFAPSMEPLRIDQTAVRFSLRGQTSLLNCGAPVVHLALSPDGALIAAACQDGTVKIWDRYRRALLSGFTVGLLPADSLAVSPDKQTILAGCRDLQQQGGCPVKAYAASAGEKKRYDLHALPVTALAFSPRGEKAASISWDRSVKSWETETGTVLLSGTHPQRGLAVAFSFDGTRIVSASQDGTLIVWDIPEASAVATRSIEIQGPCQAAISAGGEWAVLKEESGRAVLVNVRTGIIDAEWTTQGTPRALHASAEGAVVAWEAWGNILRPRHVQGQRYLPDPTGGGRSHDGDVRCIAVSIDGMCVVSGGDDGLVGIWEAI